MNRWPPEVEAQLIACQVAEASYVPGRDPTSLVELSKLDLANAVLEWAKRVERLPGRARAVQAVGRYRRVKRA